MYQRVLRSQVGLPGELLALGWHFPIGASSKAFLSNFISGAEGIRTPDLRLAKAEVTREQLLLT